VLIGVVVAFIAAVAGVQIFGGDEPATEEATTTTTGPLEGAAAELAGLLELRQSQTYHARYEGQSGESSTVVIETWQDGSGQVRQDQVLRSGDEGAHLISLVADGREVRCTQIATDEWTCRRAATGELSGADPVAAVRARLAAGEVTARNVDIDGQPARCFELTGQGETSELCVRIETGIPVRISGGSTELRLVVLEDAVDPSVFTPPAPVEG
jgi:hypothetical protein